MRINKTVFLLALTSVFLGGGCYILGYIITAQSGMLIKHGVHGRATVDSKKTFLTSGSGYPQTNYRLILIALRFPQIRLNWNVTKKQWLKYEVNDTVDIFYSPPNINNFIAGDEDQAVQLYSRGLVAISIGIVFLLFGATLGIAGLIFGYVKSMKQYSRTV